MSISLWKVVSIGIGPLRCNEFITCFCFFLFSTGWGIGFVFASLVRDSFDGLRFLFKRVSLGLLASGFRTIGEGCGFVGCTGDEGGSSFGFFFEGSIVRATSSVSDSLPTFVSSFFAAPAAIDRAFAALCLWRLVFIFSNLAIYIQCYVG